MNLFSKTYQKHVGRRHGVSRDVFLIGKYAFKFASPRYGYDKFLQGLLANMQETKFSKAHWPELCPVLWSSVGGFLIIMPKLRELSLEEYLKFDYEGFTHTDSYVVPVEDKPESFGWLAGKVVAIDYGN